MPGFVRTKRDEKKWTHAKEVSDAIRKKKPQKKGSNRYALANWIYHHKLSKAKQYEAPNTESAENDPQAMFEVYYIGKTGKKILCQKFTDKSEASEHLKELKKLYGKYIQAGMRETPITAFDRSMSKMKGRLSQRKKENG